MVTKKWVIEKIEDEGRHTRGHVNMNAFDDRANFNKKLKALADYLGVEIVEIPGEVVQKWPSVVVRKKKGGRKP
jgi:hypothetical protein